MQGRAHFLTAKALPFIYKEYIIYLIILIRWVFLSRFGWRLAGRGLVWYDDKKEWRKVTMKVE